jgi:hypothetical protein
MKITQDYSIWFLDHNYNIFSCKPLVVNGVSEDSIIPEIVKQFKTHVQPKLNRKNGIQVHIYDELGNLRRFVMEDLLKTTEKTSLTI